MPIEKFFVKFVKQTKWTKPSILGAFNIFLFLNPKKTSAPQNHRASVVAVAPHGVEEQRAAALVQALDGAPEETLPVSPGTERFERKEKGRNKLLFFLEKKKHYTLITQEIVFCFNFRWCEKTWSEFVVILFYIKEYGFQWSISIVFSYYATKKVPLRFRPTRQADLKTVVKSSRLSASSCRAAIRAFVEDENPSSYEDLIHLGFFVVKMETKPHWSDDF